ncbi:MAG: polysaccharide deacetylase family protein [Lachnospiraceae bacterium]|nr:polysaccharide deacetylase family protein [Lachnospiraceae bacterium]
MKKNFAYVLFIISILLSGCSVSQNNPPGQTPSPSPEFMDATVDNASAPTGTPLMNIDEYKPSEDLKTPIREYGESTAFIQMEEDLVVRILYPESQIPALNDALENWVTEIVSEYQTECIDCHINGDCGELTAEYESFLVNEHFVSIKISGVFDKPYLAHPIDIIATFHGDLTTNSLLTLDSLLLPDGRLALESKVATDAGVESEFIDEHFLDHWVLTSKGLEITLARGDYLPMSEGTKTYMYTYSELEGILYLDNLSVPKETPIEEYTDSPNPDTVLNIPPDTPINPDMPMVALTFDDGPGTHTDRLLNVFATHGGKGTFFVVGNILENRSDVLNRMVAEGHEIGGHSWDHRQLTKLNSSDLRNQVLGTHSKIQELTGMDATLLRPPYGSYNSDVQNLCADLGIVMANWSLDTLDWKYKDADKIYNTILTEVQDGDIILCHDLHGTTVDAMEQVIPELIAKGYQLVTVSELLDQKGEEIRAGEVYFRGK